MADSDEEYERRRRDKFRRERGNDYERRDMERRGGAREPWEDRTREGWSGGRGGREDRRGNQYNNREFDRNRRERYSPSRHDMSPPQMKRMRRDWEDNGFGGHFEGGFSSGPGPAGGGAHSGWGQAGADSHHGRGPEAEVPTQPAISTFKQFLQTQDDNISDEEAIRKYNEYKLEFRKTQINEFFLSHKDEEWFRSKYHPEECSRRHEESKDALKNRAAIFQKIIDMGYMKEVTCDIEKTEELVKMLDAAVILMEGGTDFDLNCLEVPPAVPEEPQRPPAEPAATEEEKKDKVEDDEVIKEDGEKKEEEKEKEKEKEKEMEDEDLEKKEDGEMEEAEEKTEVSKVSDSEETVKDLLQEPKEAAMETEPGEEEEEEAAAPAEEEPKKEEGQEEEGEEDAEMKDKPPPEAEMEEGESGAVPETNGKKAKKRKREYSFDSGSESSDSGSAGESDSEPAPPGVESEQKTETDAVFDEAKTEQKEGNEKEKNTTEDKEEDTSEEQSGEPRPRALHRTMSIFLRNLAPSITKQEVEAMCKRYPGFMRVALQDPQPERRFFRRGWVTFDRTVNIKDICWNLNNIRLRDCEMGAIVNRELKQKIRPVNGITAHKTIIRQDIKHAAKIIQNLDNRLKIWEDKSEDDKKDSEKPSFGLQSKNPVLKNITNYLVEEGSYEEEELLGVVPKEESKDANPEIAIERDIEFQTVLDRLILYLRLVHSFDFYSAVEYPNEDEMPHRCGIMHARGPPPSNKVMQSDLNEWLQTFENKLLTYLNLVEVVDEDMARKLGKKDHEEEVEKFVLANQQEVSKDKWLCPLSGKKFKGPEFIRKHIFNKHVEKVDEVKTEVSYFNNYLLDPKRPQLPEHPGNRPSGPPSGRPDNFHQPPGNFQGQMGGFGGNRPPPMWNQGNRRSDMRRRGGYGSNFPARQEGNRFEPRRERYDRFPNRRDRGRQDPRSLIEYRDLDAPDDFDIFS